MEIRPIVRVLNTDLDGHKKIYLALRKIRGFGFMYSNMILKLAEIERNKLTGELNEAQITKIEEIARDPEKFGGPVWMLNRRKDFETGESTHLLGQDINFVTDNDIKRMKRIRCYRGVRHMFNAPVRGQRTKSNFRKNKGKGSLGVKRSK